MEEVRCWLNFQGIIGWTEEMIIPDVRVVTIFQCILGRKLVDSRHPGQIPDSASVSCVTDELDDVLEI